MSFPPARPSTSTSGLAPVASAYNTGGDPRTICVLPSVNAKLRCATHDRPADDAHRRPTSVCCESGDPHALQAAIDAGFEMEPSVATIQAKSGHIQDALRESDVPVERVDGDSVRIEAGT